MKMYDFIYYNPVTNPMKSNKEQRIIAAQPMEIPEEEEEDDPLAIPVLQVKVDPDGHQLIIDEQSLVIEKKDAKRVREIMSNDIIVEDGICNNGDFYKKHKRRKEWPRWEMFKFYKQCYKKIENIQETPKKTSEKMKNDQNITRAVKRRKHRLVAKSIRECEALKALLTMKKLKTQYQQVTRSIAINSEANDAHQQMGREAKYKKDDWMINPIHSDDDSVSHFNSDSGSFPEIYRVRPIRSGRQPKKMKKLQTPNIKKLNTPNVNMISDGDIENESSVIDNENVISSYAAIEVTKVVNTSIKNGESAETSCPDNHFIGTKLL